MARDIRIHPKLNSTTANDFPKIDFGGLSASTISLKVDDDGSVVYTGTYGVLFNVTDDKDGLLHSVNDVSGLPILQVYSWDYVQMGKWDKYTLTVNSDKVGIGLTAPTDKLHIYDTSGLGAFRLEDGTQQNGYVLTSDANGLATWQPAVTLKVTNITSSATPSIDYDVDQYNITALATNITSVSLSGTFVDRQRLIVTIKDNGTARTITWGSSFNGTWATLPTTTVVGNTWIGGFIYNATTSKYECVASFFSL